MKKKKMFWYFKLLLDVALIANSLDTKQTFFADDQNRCVLYKFKGSFVINANHYFHFTAEKYTFKSLKGRKVQCYFEWFHANQSWFKLHINKASQHLIIHCLELCCNFPCWYSEWKPFLLSNSFFSINTILSNIHFTFQQSKLSPRTMFTDLYSVKDSIN